MASRYDDELWELVSDPAPAPAHIVEFVQSLPHAEGVLGRAEHALDLGCGDGRLTAELRADHVTAADVSAVALSRAARRVPEATMVELTPDAVLPFGDNVFDVVLTAQTIEHVRDTQLFLSEARRVLRPRGTLAVATPAHRRWIGAPDPFSPRLRFYTRRSLTRVLDATGFDVADVRRRRGTLLARATR